MTEKKLDLHFGLPGLNEIIDAAKRSPHTYATLKKTYTRLVADELFVQDCIPDMPYEKMYLYFTWIETAQHRRDPDNVRAGAKFILDAMVQVGMIEDDSISHVKLLRDSFRIGESRAVVVSWNKITNTTEKRQI